ncbi:hypothetical protein E0765_04735 [Sulfuricurvum sp. IAE1]|uniref:hypothetical protein n=1 Tax=Sulfuricurvum sp. IAE1 TaxID=2546102 RepID=UPI00104B64F0|nr:hypothetical protein [Sulfuricurvum sp. IAE1]TDA65791.1 hypothetical protein E0765_04735 [Sulfuricurvum sp. IAE1]
MKYWNNTEAMSWLRAFAFAFTSVMLAMGYVGYRMDTALKSVGMTAEEFYGPSSIGEELFAYLMVAVWIVSVVLYLYGKFMQKRHKTVS